MELDQFSKFDLFLNRRRLTDPPRFFVIDLEGYLNRKPPIEAATIEIGLTDSNDGQIMFNVNTSNDSLGVNYEEGFLKAGAEAGDFGLNLLKNRNEPLLLVLQQGKPVGRLC